MRRYYRATTNLTLPGENHRSPSPGTEASSWELPVGATDTATLEQPMRSLTGVRIGAARLDKRGEDRLLLQPQAGLFGVFDGAGGQQNAAAAAQAAADAVAAHVLPKAASCGSLEDTVALLIGALHTADAAVAAGAAGGATTATVVLMPPSTALPLLELPAVVANVGDSRVGLLRNHFFEFVTLDHGLSWGAAPPQAKARQDRLDAARDPLLLIDELDRAAFAQRRLLTHALTGQADLDVRTYVLKLQPGDRLLLDSDGLHDNLTAAEIATLLDTAANAQAAASALARAALSRSREPRERWPRAKTDDISAVVIEWPYTAGRHRSADARVLASGETIEVDLDASPDLRLVAGDLHVVLTRRGDQWWAIEDGTPIVAGAPRPGPGCWALSPGEPVRIGRHEHGFWNPPSLLVSRQHLAVTLLGQNRASVTDLGSRNGTQVVLRPAGHP